MDWREKDGAQLGRLMMDGAPEIRASVSPRGVLLTVQVPPTPGATPDEMVAEALKQGLAAVTMVPIQVSTDRRATRVMTYGDDR